MHYKSLILSFFLFYSLSTPVEATTDDKLEKMLKNAGVEFTPTKSALGRVASGGRPALRALLVEQENARIHNQQQEVEKREILAQLQEKAKEENRQRENAELLENAQREKENQLAKEKAKSDRLFEALRAEQEEQLKQQREAQERQLEILKREQEEKRERERIEYVRQLEILKREYDAQFERERAESRRQLAEAQQAVEGQREGVVVGEAGELQAQLAQVREERDSLLSKLMTIATGQAHLSPAKSEFIAYASPYIHLNNLKEPDTTLDAQLHQNLGVIHENVDTLIDTIPNIVGLKGVQKMMIKRQLGRLNEGVENFEAAVFLSTFSETRDQLSLMANEVAYKSIEKLVKWIEENRVRLSKVGEHQAYSKRQKEAAILVEQKRADFDSFLEDYIDRFVAGMCVWLAPTRDDGSAVREGKLEFMSKLLTSSIPLVKNYLYGPMPVFGTRDTFLSQTFMRCLRGKDYGVFKETLQLYSAIFTGLGEHQKLVEELLNYEFFQKRYRLGVEVIQREDLSVIQDRKIRGIIETMRDKDVLKFQATDATLFAVSISEVLNDCINKVDIPLEQVSLWAQIKKLLIAYSQIHAFSINLREGNPKIIEFHDQ